MDIPLLDATVFAPLIHRFLNRVDCVGNVSAMREIVAHVAQCSQVSKWCITQGTKKRTWPVLFFVNMEILDVSVNPDT